MELGEGVELRGEGEEEEIVVLAVADDYVGAAEASDDVGESVAVADDEDGACGVLLDGCYERND